MGKIGDSASSVLPDDVRNNGSTGGEFYFGIDKPRERYRIYLSDSI